LFVNGNCAKWFASFKDVSKQKVVPLSRATVYISMCHNVLFQGSFEAP